MALKMTTHSGTRLTSASMAPAVRPVGRVLLPAKPFSAAGCKQSFRGVPLARAPASLAQETIVENSGPKLTEQTATTEEAYSWTSRWWPVHDVASLDPKIPQKIDLMGKSLVVWGDSKGEWHCLEDECSHRKAPLSEGRVEGDVIMCCYHGWTFDGKGACTNIPQLPKAEIKAAACSNPRSCVKSFPVMVENGLLWVWPESGPDAALKAVATKATELVDKRCTAWFCRDVPIRWDTLVENALDPSHVPFAHHGVQGNRNKPHRGWETMRVIQSDAAGFLCQTEPTGLGVFSIRYTSPGFLRYELDGTRTGPQACVVPTKPGWSKLIANFPLTFDKLPPALRTILAIRKATSNVAFLDHMERNDVIDGDTYMLHIAERLLPASKGIGKQAIKTYYMPSGADAAVIAFRNWVEDHAGQVPTCEPNAVMPPEMSKEKVLDRYEQHIKNCSSCRNALATVDKLRSLTTWVGLAAAVVAVAQLVSVTALAALKVLPASQAAASTLPAFIPSGLAGLWQSCQAAGLGAPLLWAAGIAVVCAAVYHWLTNKIRVTFFYKEYIHALRD